MFAAMARPLSVGGKISGRTAGGGGVSYEDFSAATEELDLFDAATAGATVTDGSDAPSPGIIATTMLNALMTATRRMCSHWRVR